MLKCYYGYYVSNHHKGTAIQTMTFSRRYNAPYVQHVISDSGLAYLCMVAATICCGSPSLEFMGAFVSFQPEENEATESLSNTQLPSITNLINERPESDNESDSISRLPSQPTLKLPPVVAADVSRPPLVAKGDTGRSVLIQLQQVRVIM